MLTSEEPLKIPSAEPPAAVIKEVKYSPKSSPEEEQIPVTARRNPPPSEPPPLAFPSLFSLLGKMPFFERIKGFLPEGLFGAPENRKERKFGAEEILLLTVAGFLLLSKEGDRECAVFLLLLLFL